jgi:predicted kinase
LLIALAGLPGSGKSVLAHALQRAMEAALQGAMEGPLGRALPAVILDKDRVRAALFPPEEIEYSARQDDLCMEAVFQAAAFLLHKGRTVLLDGRLYARAYQVERLLAFAHEINAPLKLIECAAPDEFIRQRLEADVAESRHPAQNRTFAMYCQIKAAADPITFPHLVVDTSRSLEECVADCLTYILQGFPTPPHPPAPSPFNGEGE